MRYSEGATEKNRIAGTTNSAIGTRSTDIWGEPAYLRITPSIPRKIVTFYKLPRTIEYIRRGRTRSMVNEAGCCIRHDESNDVESRSAIRNRRRC